jgi:hypothetical protein
VALLLALLLQAEPFEGLFRREPGSVWTYRKTESGVESRVALTLLRREKGRLTFDEKETRGEEADPRAVSVVLALSEGFLVLERRIDAEAAVVQRLLKLDAREGEAWEGGERLKDDGPAVRVRAGDLECRLKPDEGLCRMDRGGASLVLAGIEAPRWAPVLLEGRYNARLTKAWHPSRVPEAEFNDLSSLPRGVQTFGGVPFDARGVLQLGGQQAREFPEKAAGLPVGVRAARLHFLHAVGWASPTGTPVGTFTVRYGDGSAAEVPIVYGEDVSDWWQLPRQRFKGTKGRVAWIGSNPACRGLGAVLKLYRTVWENPKPELEIASVDYASSMTNSAPFLVALTAEKR